MHVKDSSRPTCRGAATDVGLSLLLFTLFKGLICAPVRAAARLAPAAKDMWAGVDGLPPADGTTHPRCYQDSTRTRSSPERDVRSGDLENDALQGDAEALEGQAHGQSRHGNREVELLTQLGDRKPVDREVMYLDIVADLRDLGRRHTFDDAEVDLGLHLVGS